MANKKLLRRTALDYRERVCRAMNFISLNLERDLKLEEVAAEAAFSPFHFHRIFRAVTGETIGEFTRRLRLEWAANRLLARPNDSITTLAIECGFSSSQNFARSFRTHFGTTPTEFRESKIGHKISNEGNALSLRPEYTPDFTIHSTSNRDWRETMQGEVKTLPEQRVAFVRKLGPYGKETCEAAFGELMRWAGPRGLIGPSTMRGVYWDNPEITPPQKCRVDACVIVPDGTTPEPPVGLQTLPGGPHGICHFEITETEFQQAWEDAFAWLVESGYECADQPCFELYHVDPEHHPEGKWVVDICIPLKTEG